MLELPTEVPELEDSAKAAALRARGSAKVVVFQSDTLKVKESEVVVTRWVAEIVKTCEDGVT